MRRLATIGSAWTSTPSTSTWPRSGDRMPASIRSVVVLPAPFGPSRPTISPGLTARDTSATAITSPKRLPSERASRPPAVSIIEVQSYGRLDPRGAPQMAADFSGIRTVLPPVNEPIRSYAPGIARAAPRSRRGWPRWPASAVDIPLVIGGKDVRTGDLGQSVMPHDHGHVLADCHHAAPERRHGGDRRRAARPRREWASWPWEDRAAVFLKAADLLATTWRDTLNAATMLGQSKTVYQAEIDAACELIDFWRFNVAFAGRPDGRAAGLDHGDVEPDRLPRRSKASSTRSRRSTSRPSAATSPTAPALMGNTVVWKPAASGDAERLLHAEAARGRRPAAGRDQLRARRPGDGQQDRARRRRDLAGIHFTGSTGVFQGMWKTVGAQHRALPRRIRAWSARPAARTSSSRTRRPTRRRWRWRIVRGGFEYQGQKCSAASRVYVPQSLWPEVRDRAVGDDARDQDGRRARLPQLHGRGDRQEGVHEDQRLHRPRASGTRRSSQGGGSNGRDGLLHRADAGRDRRPRLPAAVRGDLRAGASPRYAYPDAQVARDAAGWSTRPRPYALTGAVFARDRARHPRGVGGAAQRRRQLLHQRQADRRGGRPAAVRRRARLGHQRQGRLEAEPAALGERPDDQGDLRPADATSPTRSWARSSGPPRTVP